MATDCEGNIEAVVDEQRDAKLLGGCGRGKGKGKRQGPVRDQWASPTVRRLLQRLAVAPERTLSVTALAAFATLRKSRVEAVFSRSCTTVTPPVGPRDSMAL
jgi:transcriptional regulator GlxA family with amidase domain